MLPKHLNHKEQTWLYLLIYRFFFYFHNSFIVWMAYAMSGVVRMPHTSILVVWKKYALMHCIWKAHAPPPVIRKVNAMVGVVWIPHTLRPIVGKKRIYFDNSLPARLIRCPSLSSMHTHGRLALEATCTTAYTFWTTLVSVHMPLPT